VAIYKYSKPSDKAFIFPGSLNNSQSNGLYFALGWAKIIAVNKKKKNLYNVIFFLFKTIY
tara:strand:- start:318 stop:497 length:180 start_codon:yes stop_codon:yes gene_type:complete